MKKYCSLGISICVIASLYAGSTQASSEGFVTIIGPDGFPLVVPYTKPAKVEVPRPAKAVAPRSIETLRSKGISLETSDKASKESDISIKKSVQIAEKSSVVQQQKTTTVQQPLLSADKNASSLALNEKPSTSLKSDLSSAQDHLKNYIEIEGEKYYDSEYLESKEFNLEDKTRFYQVPASAGGGNWDVIERVKGVDMSWFNTRNQKNNIFETIVLGEQYAVLDKASLEEALPNKCLDQKSLKKSKRFDKDLLSLWARAPFKNEFDYELVSIQGRQVQNFKLSSFAKSDKERKFYWPLVVFLDQQGCVIEGASGYYTQGYAPTPLQTEVIEGNLQIPTGTQYMMFTPLMESVDLPDKIMSNQGQVTLTILR